MAETGDTVATLQPIYLQPWFVGSQGALVLCLAAGLFFQRRQERHVNDADGIRRQAASGAIARCLVEMDTAADAGDTTRFFAAARTALQQRLAARWQIAPASITQSDLDGHPEVDQPETRRVFAMADEVAYSGVKLSIAAFLQWKETVRRQLKQLETP
jgi:hypothetical protein